MVKMLEFKDPKLKSCVSPSTIKTNLYCRPLALAMPLGSVPGHGEDPTSLYRTNVANRNIENVGDGMSPQRNAEMSELEVALQNLNPSDVERRRKMFQQQQYRWDLHT